MLSDWHFSQPLHKEDDVGSERSVIDFFKHKPGPDEIEIDGFTRQSVTGDNSFGKSILSQIHVVFTNLNAPLPFGCDFPCQCGTIDSIFSESP